MAGLDHRVGLTRDFKGLARAHVDVLVVGAGITGAAIAWDATLRGLSVVLVDKGDFGGATSANSLKILHGGLRYLQNLDFRRIRGSVRERTALMRIAPHLTHPLACLVPIYSGSLKGRAVMKAALAANDLFSWDRNQGLDAHHRIAPGAILSRDDCRERAPFLPAEGLMGAALWYDSQAHNTERLTVSFVMSAAQRGAVVCNYAAVTSLLREGGRVVGARLWDELDGGETEIRAPVVVNAAGPWAESVAKSGEVQLGGSTGGARLALATNLVVPGRRLMCAIGVRSKAALSEDPVCGGHRYLFLAPWGNHMIVGTHYTPYRGDPDGARVTETDVSALVREVNEACPALGLREDGVSRVHRGLMPLNGGWPGKRRRPLGLLPSHQIVDHALHGTSGLLSVVAVKYTTARGVAQQAVDRIFAQLGRKVVGCRTAQIPLWGGDGDGGVALEVALSAAAVGRLRQQYGNRVSEVVKCRADREAPVETLGCDCAIHPFEIRHAVRHEMAVRLSDVVLRRTEMGAAGCPTRPLLEKAARIMGDELAWGPVRCSNEVEAVLEAYDPLKNADLQ